MRLRQVHGRYGLDPVCGMVADSAVAWSSGRDCYFLFCVLAIVCHSHRNFWRCVSERRGVFSLVSAPTEVV